MSWVTGITRQFQSIGFSDEGVVDASRKVLLINVICLTGVAFLIPLSLIAILQGNIALAAADLTAASILCLNLLYLRRTGNYRFSSVFGITVTGLLYLYLLVTGGVNNTAHVWCYTYPLAAFFLLGARKGSAASLILLAAAVIFFILDIRSPLFTSYSRDFIVRFIPSYTVVFLFSLAYESFRESSEQQLVSKNEELNRTIDELTETDAKLRRAGEELEKRVRERTEELLRINSDLKQEIKERRRVETERTRLEARLTQSLKMEAIGTLAGGVAHDLNNILSASVSIPDLILLDTPENSPIREQLLLIGKSGRKAAAIVSDLLTLARRGVSVSEIVDLNLVVRSYLESPEFNELRKTHPDLDIETDLSPLLFSIQGSSVHLSKTVMNLVCNAAEAIDGVGRISITTENRNLATPVKGYDSVEKGDYIVLSISDTGRGIPAEDIDRIFDPFFTRKTFGRSGTGLGMTVVWGTVEDHNGYIDVVSEEGRGSVFSLYFPASRGKVRSPVSNENLSCIMGSGESVLVVDDVQLQRRIVSDMLTKLGYSVTTVSSGEQAVDYLAKNKVDILILDMEMDPGIDGLETYRRILLLHPEQKAIIASGYSATNRVRELQILGAGIYLMKPYTITDIGRAIRDELEK